MFLAFEPVSRVDILVGVDEHALTLLAAIPPLPVVLAFVGVDQPADSVLAVIFEIPVVDVGVGVGVLAFTAPQLYKIGGTPSR